MAITKKSNSHPLLTGLELVDTFTATNVEFTAKKGELLIATNYFKWVNKGAFEDVIIYSCLGGYMIFIAKEDTSFSFNGTGGCTIHLYKAKFN